MSSTVQPITSTGLYEVHEDPGERVCHIVGDDGGWLCGGKRPAPGEPSRGTHITRHPGDAACDGCGLPRGRQREGAQHVHGPREHLDHARPLWAPDAGQRGRGRDAARCVSRPTPAALKPVRGVLRQGARGIKSFSASLKRHGERSTDAAFGYGNVMKTSADDLPPDAHELATLMRTERPVASNRVLQRAMSRAHDALRAPKGSLLWRATPPRPRGTSVAFGVAAVVAILGAGGMATAAHIDSTVPPPAVTPPVSSGGGPSGNMDTPVAAPGSGAPAAAPAPTPAPSPAATPASATTPATTPPGTEPGAASPTSGGPTAPPDGGFPKQVSQVQKGEHPFTGLSLGLLALGGAMLAASGVALRRRQRH